MGIRKYTWEEFASDVEKIARTIESWGKKFRYVYGIPRGGLVLAVCLSHRLKIEHLTLHPTSEQVDVGFKSILIVDDIADTGKTLENFRHAGFFIVTLFKH